MTLENKTNYKLRTPGTDLLHDDKDWMLDSPFDKGKSLIYTEYEKKQLELNRNLSGIYQFSDWLPVSKTFEGSGAPITYKSEKLAFELGLENLYITFNGYWPEKGAFMKTGSFKECEAYSVCARSHNFDDKTMVVASAGNTARAFARVCSENNIPLVLCVPYDALNSVWSIEPLNPCVKILSTPSGTDYYDAIELSNKICQLDGFFPEGGAKNIARRDGMGTTVLSAVTTIGRIPDYYFQAIGSGTGGIAAWEANKRFISDGRYGRNLMKLMLVQNIPFSPMYDAWSDKSRELTILNDKEAKEKTKKVYAKVLTNRRPPYSIKGGVYDAVKDSGGQILISNNSDAEKAANMFYDLEGCDIEPAAAVALAGLIDSVNKGIIDKKSYVMLNVTGGGYLKINEAYKTVKNKASYIFNGDETLEEIQSILNK